MDGLLKRGLSIVCLPKVQLGTPESIQQVCVGRSSFQSLLKQTDTLIDLTFVVGNPTLDLVHVGLIGVQFDATPQMPERFIGLTDIEVRRA